MRSLFVILFFSSKIFAQDSLYFKTVSYDLGVVNYQIQSSPDTINWTNIVQIQPTKNKDSNNYSYPLQTPNMYIRIKANMVQSNAYYTSALFYAQQSQNSATISNAKFSNSWFTDKLSWTVSKTMNVYFYLIEKSVDNGKSWGLQTKINPNVSNSYSYSVFRLFSP